MKRIFITLSFFICCSLAHAQTPGAAPDFIPAGIRQYQFSLPKEGKEIRDLEYTPSGEPAKGNLSPDGKSVILENYRKGSRVKLTVMYPDGTSEEILKSPCYIDPVSYEL